MHVGVDYYPEHWDESLWQQDAAAMREAGISIVRLAEFAWSRLEPAPGQFEFAWLDRAIDVLAEQGIQVVLGTPTATPPNWLIEMCPDILPVDHKKQSVYPGVRCHRCYNSASLRKHTELIVDALTRHYAGYPAVIGWQTDNELAANDCHCEQCTQAFRSWLQRKYGDLATVNREWGTVVWSGEYSSWAQITTPLGGSAFQNPSFLLDFQRFSSDSVADFNRFQAALIRKNCSSQFVTHNLWGYPVVTDYYQLFDSMDFVSVDYYPSTDLNNHAKANIYHGALTLDLTRGVQRKNFWVMEQLSGTPGCWNPMSRTPFPGMIRAHAWQSIAHGADTVVQFRWRTARIGAEQFWHGLHDHHGVPGRRFEEFKRFSGEVAQLSPMLDGTTVKNSVAMLFSHEQHNALKIQPQADGFDYLSHFKQLHRAFLRLGVGTDVINWTESLQGYQLVLAPMLFLEDPLVVERLQQFVATGGTLVVTTRSGVKNLNNVCLEQRLPGLLSQIAGVEVEEYDPVGNDVQQVSLFDTAVNCSQWCDILTPVTAQTLASYTSEFYAGRSAVTCNQFGLGQVYYIGTVLEDVGYQKLFSTIARKLNLETVDLPEGVEIARRCGNGKEFLFILNLSKTAQSIQLPARERECAFSGLAVDSQMQLEAGAVKILLEKSLS